VREGKVTLSRRRRVLLAHRVADVEQFHVEEHLLAVAYQLAGELRPPLITSSRPIL
jgi:hypothetical protein